MVRVSMAWIGSTVWPTAAVFTRNFGSSGERLPQDGDLSFSMEFVQGGLAWPLPGAGPGEQATD